MSLLSFIPINYYAHTLAHAHIKVFPYTFSDIKKRVHFPKVLATSPQPRDIIQLIDTKFALLMIDCHHRSFSVIHLRHFSIFWHRTFFCCLFPSISATTHGKCRRIDSSILLRHYPGKKRCLSVSHCRRHLVLFSKIFHRVCWMIPSRLRSVHHLSFATFSIPKCTGTLRRKQNLTTVFFCADRGAYLQYFTNAAALRFFYFSHFLSQMRRLEYVTSGGSLPPRRLSPHWVRVRSRSVVKYLSCS